jgi:hypothetical protein
LRESHSDTQRFDKCGRQAAAGGTAAFPKGAKRRRPRDAIGKAGIPGEITKEAHMKKLCSKRILTLALATMMLLSAAAFSASATEPEVTQSTFFYLDRACLVPAPMGQDMVWASQTTNDKGEVHLVLHPTTTGGYMSGIYAATDPHTNIFVQDPDSDPGFGYADYTADFIRDDGGAVLEAELEIHGMPFNIHAYIKVDETA